MERVERHWGSYAVLDQGTRYKIKRTEVKPGHSLSLHMHYHRSEHWIVVSGTAKATCGDIERTVHINESTYIPIGARHRLENPGVIPLVIIEVQTGEYLGEDDIIRFIDGSRFSADPAKDAALTSPALPPDLQPDQA